MSANLSFTSASKPLPRGWLIVALLCVVGGLNYLDRVMIATMRESIVNAMPMTDAQFGLLTSVFLWVYGLLSPFAGFLADKFNRSRVIIVSLFVWSGVTWLTAHATNFEELLATRALMGISEACYLPAALALITDYHRGSTRSLATGIHMVGVMVGQSLGFLGGWMADRHNWSYAFSILGLIGLIYSCVLAFLLRDTPDRKPVDTNYEKNFQKVNFLEGIRDLFSKRAFIILLAFWGLLGIVGWLIIAWLPTYYYEHFHLSQAVSGFYATGYIYPVSMVGLVAGGILADQLTKKYSRARIIVPAIGLVIAAPAVYIASSTAVVWIAIGGFIFYAFTRIFSDGNLMPILCMIADKRYRATGYGILNLFACVVGGIGVYASGVLRDAKIDLSILFKVAALAMLICAGMLFMIKPKYDDNKIN